MAEGPDVRALKHFLGGGAWGLSRPVECVGCPFSRPYPPDDGLLACDLLGGPEPVNHQRPPCNADQWRQRARIELDLLECDSAALAAVAHDAREESLMYARGLREGAAAEREACCKAACSDCDQGRPVAADADGNWRHRDGQWCRAHAIRRRAGEDGR